jgi:hypothetical protein
MPVRCAIPAGTGFYGRNRQVRQFENDSYDLHDLPGKRGGHDD